MNIIFFGSDPFAIPSLKMLANSRHRMMAVVSPPDKPAGRGQKVTPCPCAAAARQMKLQLYQPKTLSGGEAASLLKLKPELLVVVAYGKFLPQSLIEAVPRRAVNLHPSLLPKYRGAAPMQWAILNGEKKTGVTTATIAQEMDAGDIYLQSETPLGAAETLSELEEQLSRLGAQLLLKTIDGIEAGDLHSTPQDASQVTFAPKLKKEDGRLDFSESAEKLDRKIRGLNPWPGTFCRWQGNRLKILKAEAVAMPGRKPPGSVIEGKEELMVACGQGTLRLLEVQLEGKKRMSTSEFLKGHSMEIGEALQ